MMHWQLFCDQAWLGNLMGSFGPTAGFSASLLGEPSPPSWLPWIIGHIFYVKFLYIPCIIGI